MTQICFFSKRLASATEYLRRSLSLLLVTIVFSACQAPGAGTGPSNKSRDTTTPPVAQPSPPSAEQVAAREREARRLALRASAQAALKEGQELYDRGDYSGTIKKLMGTQELFQTDTDVQLEAYKYLAFSYCLSKRQTQCADSFNKAFALDSSFDLAPAERGHPMWGPVFDRVKKTRSKQ